MPFVVASVWSLTSTRFPAPSTTPSMVRRPPVVRLILPPVVATRTGAFQARSGFGLVAIGGSAADTVAPRRSMVAMECFSSAPLPLWGGGGGGGRGVGRDCAPRHDPPPQPSPTRGEGVATARPRAVGTLRFAHPYALVVAGLVPATPIVHARCFDV